MDLYVVLGVRREASDGDIRRAYRRLARRYHPDINPGDAAAAAHFRDILTAYETLIDPERRRRYDHVGVVPAPAGATVAPGFAGFDFSPRVRAERTTTFGDLFSGSAPAPPRPARGIDLHVALELTIEDVMRASRHTVAVTRQVSCAACAGTGSTRGGAAHCVACDGTGEVRSVRGHMLFTAPCARCGGGGRGPRERCASCGGRAVETRSEPVTVEVPAGVDTGAVLRFAGLGHAGLAGAPPGDLFVTVAVRSHPLYRRKNDDLHLDVPVAVHEAALGARIALPTIDGAALRLRVPPGTQSGQRFRLRERGLPSRRDGRRGDLVAEIRVMLPQVLDERSKELLREFGHLQRDSVRDARFPGGDGA